MSTTYDSQEKQLLICQLQNQSRIIPQQLSNKNCFQVLILFGQQNYYPHQSLVSQETNRLQIKADRINSTVCENSPYSFYFPDYTLDLIRSDFQCVILINYINTMLFPACLTQSKQPFFLQRRNSQAQKRKNRELLSPQSKFNQKISLKSLKSIKSQRSLKTISTNEAHRTNQSPSLNCIPENLTNNVHILGQNKNLNYFLQAFTQTERVNQRTARVSNNQRKTLDLALNLLPKICITYQRNDRIRNFVSPDTRAINQQIIIDQQPKIVLKVPQQERNATFSKEVESIPQQVEAYSISVTPCLNNSSLSAIYETEKEQDMKSTHIGQQKLQLPLYFPSRAKSTVSMLSDRSSYESIIMDRQCLKFEGKISKLL